MKYLLVAFIMLLVSKVSMAQIQSVYAAEDNSLAQQKIEVLEARIMAMEKRLSLVEGTGAARSATQQTQAQTQTQTQTQTNPPPKPTVYNGNSSGLAVEDYANKTTDSSPPSNTRSIAKASSTTSEEVTPEKQKEFQKTIDNLKVQEKEKNEYIDQLMKEN